jgi:excisionase family DNA binding protein
MLGVEQSTIYAWTHRKTIPFIKLGKLVRFRLSDVESWLQSQMVNPVEKQKPQPAPMPYLKRKSKSVSGDFIDRLVNNVKKEVLNDNKA